MEFSKTERRRHQDAAPDHRADACQPNLDLQDFVGLRNRRCFGHFRLARFRSSLHAPRLSRHPETPQILMLSKKRHVLVDTQGFVLHAIVTTADIQDRDGGAMLLATLFGLFPFLLKLYADGGYQGPQFQQALKRVLSQVEV
jgi:Transposase DDE domain